MKVVDSSDRPMKSIMTIGEFSGSIMYRAACDCGADEHDLTIDLEFDKDVGLTVLTFFKKVSFSPYYLGSSNNSRWVEFKGKVTEWKERFKAVGKILTGQWLEHEASFIMYGEEQIDHFIKALEYGKKHTKEFEEEQKKQGIKQVNL